MLRLRPVALVALAVGALVTASGCGDPTACTLVGSSNLVGITLPAGVADRLTSIRVRLCQGDECEQTEFAASAHGPRGLGYIEEGIFRNDARTFQVDIDDQLAAEWDPEAESTVTVTGNADGEPEPVVEHKETFRFETVYPNGRECDEVPFIQHEVIVPRGESH